MFKKFRLDTHMKLCQNSFNELDKERQELLIYTPVIELLDSYEEYSNYYKFSDDECKFMYAIEWVLYRLHDIKFNHRDLKGGEKQC